MATFEIPTIAANQKFVISLNAVSYAMTLRWNNFANAWVLDMATSDDVPILSGIPLVANTNLLEQYDYLNLGGKLFAITKDDFSQVPTFENLGTGSALYFVTEDSA